MKEYRLLLRFIASNFEERNPFVLFLGSKTSLESQSKTMIQAIDRFLGDYSKESQEMVNDKTKRFCLILDKFSEVDRTILLRNHFKDMNPSPGYEYLASLLEIGLFSVVITTNLDTMLEQSLKKTNLVPNRDYKLFTVGEDKEDNLLELLDSYNRMIKIIKLHGDISSNAIQFSLTETVEYPDKIRNALHDLTKNNMLLIGYSSIDRDILKFLNRKGRSLYWINKKSFDFDDSNERLLASYFIQRKSYENQLIGEFSDFDRFFRKLCKDLPEFGIMVKIIEPLSDWKVIGEKTKFRTQLTLEHLSKDKYKKSVYIRRKKIEEQFKNFANSEKTVFVIVGESGMGKTNICCHLCESLLNDGNSVLLYNGALIPHADIAQIIAKDLRSELELEVAFEKVNQLARKHSKKLFIFIDAINEYEDPVQLLRFVNDLIGRISQENIKVVFTCRSTIWKQIFRVSRTNLYWSRFYTEGDEKILEMSSLEEKEKERMFNKYKFKYHFLSNYGDIPIELKRKMDVPIIFDLMAKIYKNREIPKKRANISLFDEYYDNFIEKKSPLDARLFLDEMISYMREKKSDRISYRDIYTHSIMSRLIEINEINSPLIQLLDENILTEISRNDLKFTHERFFEFLLAKNILYEFGNRINSKIVNKLLQENSEFNCIWEAAKLIIVSKADFNILKDLFGSTDPRVRGFAIDTASSLSETDRTNVLSFLKSVLASGEIEEKRSALRVINEKFEKDIDILIIALQDSRSIIHDEAMKYLMRILERDKTRNLEMLDYFSKNLIGSNGKLQKQFLRSYVECTFAIAENFYNERETLLSLIHSWCSVFKKCFVGKLVDIQNERVMTMTQVITDLTRERFYKIFCSTKNIDYIFDLTQKEKENFKYLVKYITSIEEIDKKAQDLILKYCSVGVLGAEEDHEFREYPLEIPISIGVLLVQATYHYERTIEILKSLFNHGNYLVRDTVLMTLTVMTLSGISEEMSFALLKELTDKLMNQHRDELLQCAGYEQSYAPLGEIGFCQCWLDPDSKTIEYYDKAINSIITQEDWEMLPTILHTIREFLMLSPGKTLNLCEKIVRAHVEEPRSVLFLRRMLSEINACYPELMDAFFVRNADHLDESFLNEVRYYTDPNLSRQQINTWTYSIYYRLLFLDSLPMRKEVGEMLNEMVEFSSLEEFVNFLVRRLMDWLSLTEFL